MRIAIANAIWEGIPPSKLDTLIIFYRREYSIRSQFIRTYNFEGASIGEACRIKEAVFLLWSEIGTMELRDANHFFGPNMNQMDNVGEIEMVVQISHTYHSPSRTDPL
jgi:hypothetical protein